MATKADGKASTGSGNHNRMLCISGAGKNNFQQWKTLLIQDIASSPGGMGDFGVSLLKEDQTKELKRFDYIARGLNLPVDLQFKQKEVAAMYADRERTKANLFTLIGTRIKESLLKRFNSCLIILILIYYPLGNPRNCFVLLPRGVLCL